MLFLGGFIVGIIVSITIDAVLIILWKKFIKAKIDDAIFKAGLKAIEKQKEKE